MTNTQSFAKRELDILAATVPDAILTPFSKEILALCEAFGRSGQSGGSAPFTATVISNSLKHLLLQEPICDVTGHESEWMDITDINNGEPMWQNIRCSALFKDKDGRCSYVNSVVWKRDRNDMFSGWVYTNEKDFELISSSQFIKSFPFKPKTFYIDVIYVPIEKQEAEERKMHFIEDMDGKCHYSVVKSQNQLEKVWKYYDKRIRTKKQ